MFDKYPYTDFHEMNLDWIIKEMKELIDSWDSFSGNVSAEAHVSTEPEVTVQGDLKTGLTFDFGLVQGQRGAQGQRGPQGEQGPAGNGLEILDIYPTLAALQSAHPTGTPGDAYLVGSGGNYTLYIWSETASAWSDGGSLTSPAPSNNSPAMDGTAAAGSSLLYARGDHVHPSDSTKLNVSNNDGVYAVVDGDQVMRVPSSTPSAGSIVEYDSNGYVAGNNVILNSPKLDGIAASSNAYQPLTTVSANTPVLGLGEDLSLNTPSVKFMGTKFANDGTSSDATSEVNFSSSFKINDSDYTESRIDLNPATSSRLGGIKVGNGLNISSDGTLSRQTNNLLWSNSNPAAEFASQSIQISELANYKFILVDFVVKGSTNYRSSSIIPINNVSHVVTSMNWDGSTNLLCGRTLMARSDNSIEIYTGYVFSTYGTGTQNNNYMIPVSIYGIE